MVIYLMDACLKIMISSMLMMMFHMIIRRPDFNVINYWIQTFLITGRQMNLSLLYNQHFQWRFSIFWSLISNRHCYTTIFIEFDIYIILMYLWDVVFFNTFQDKIDRYVDSGESFELFSLIGLASLDIILQCAFSYESNCQQLG